MLELPETDAELAVVVGTHNRLDQLQRMIDSVFRETRTPVVIYVTDAGSDDGTIEYLKEITGPRLFPVFVGKRVGQAKAYNDVFRQVKTPYVCWLSDDNEIVNGGLDIAIGILKDDRDIGMVALKVRDIVGPFVDAPYVGGVSTIGVLNVNQGVLPTHVLRETEYFSETFGFYGIDPDLTAKVLYAGYDIVYTKAVAIHHSRNWPSDRNSEHWRNLRAHHEKANALYEAKYAGFGAHDRWWQRKQAMWSWLRAKLGSRYSIHNKRKVFGLIARDWHNILWSRHISLLDPLASFRKPYHLRQSAAYEDRLATLPPDPPLPPA